MVGARSLALVLALSCALLFALAGAGTALALPSSFGEAGEGAGQLEEPHGAAVEQASGDTYLVDTNNSRVDEFGPEGEFVRAWGWGVSDGSRELQTCTHACQPGIQGTHVGQFSTPSGIALDSHGDVYVVDSSNFRVEKFDSSGHFLAMFGKEVNLTTKGDICEANAGEECGPGQQTLEPGALYIASSITVDSAGTVLVGDYGRVEEFTEAGAYVGQFPVGEGVLVSSVAANASNEVYVSGIGLSGVHTYDTFGSETAAPIDTEKLPLYVTVGPSNEVFIANKEEILDNVQQPYIVEYAPTHSELDAFDSEGEQGGRGIVFSDPAQRLYVLNAHAVLSIAPPAAGPVVATESAGALMPTTAQLSAVLDREGNATSYRFEYGTSEAYGSSTETEALEGEPFANQQVSASIAELRPSTAYHFRVVATDSLGHVTYGPDETFTTLPPVLIDSESASQVTPESARLSAQINPLGSATEYRIEYGLSTTYEDRVPATDASAGEGIGDVMHSIIVEKLSPGTLYHYRVVAHNKLGEVTAADHTFTTQAANVDVGLADGRRWEMVSPPDKKGVSLEALPTEGGLTQASASGDALTYIAEGPISDEAKGNRSGAYTQLLARRSAGGWSTQDITAPHEQPTGFVPGEKTEYLFFSEDLSKGILEPEGATPLSPAATERTPYLRQADGEYVPLVTAANVPPGTKFQGTELRPEHFGGGVSVAGAATDESHVIVSSPLALTPGFTANASAGLEPQDLYEWAGGKLQLVSWLPGEEGRPEEVPAGEIGAAAELGGNIARDAVSSDGSRVIFTDVLPGAGLGNLISRDMQLGKSLVLDPGPTVDSKYQTASSDGRVVFFTDEGRLTSNSKAARSEADLYECEIKETAQALKCALTDISTNGREAGGVLNLIVGSDEQGRHVFFVANGALTSNSVHGDCKEGVFTGALPPTDSRCNMYMYDTSTHEIRLVAVISGRDFGDWAGSTGENLSGLTARVSPNGRYMAFMSQLSLTGYDNTDAVSGQADEEVFLYDAERDRLTCVSCDPTGARPLGRFDAGIYPGLLVDRPQIWASDWLAGSVPGWTRNNLESSDYQSRYLSNEGRLFFNSSDGLVPQDVNGEFDVYEYEPEGIGSCRKESGCVALMSSGRSSGETAFLDASGMGPGGQEGEDVFFLTADKLSPRDQDSLFDVYDAHVCTTESPCIDESGVAGEPCATVESCRSGGTLPEALAPAPSSVVSGSGNVVPRGARALTRAQQLSRALTACHKKHRKRRRACEAQARRRYGVRHKGDRKRRRTK
jgi:hypothetical protein